MTNRHQYLLGPGTLDVEGGRAGAPVATVNFANFRRAGLHILCAAPAGSRPCA